MPCRRKVFLLAAALLVAPVPAIAQSPSPLPQPGDGLSTAKAMDHDVYDIWNRITGQALSDDGRWALYHIVSEANDPRLIVRPLGGGTPIEIERAEGGRLSEDGRFVVFRLKPSKAAVEQAEEEDVPDDEMPKDSVGILDLTTGQIVARYERIKGFEMPAEAGGWVAIALEAPAGEEGDSAQAQGGERPQGARRGGARGGNREGKRLDDGTPLVVRNLASGQDARIEDVVGYRFSDDGRYLAYVVSPGDDAENGTFGAYVRTLESGTTTPLLEGRGNYKALVFDDESQRIAFLSNSADWEARQPAWTLYVADGAAAARPIATAGSAGIPEGWWVSDNENPAFSDDGTRVFFGTAPRPAPPDTTEEDEDEKVVLDVWAWTDPLLQPMQLQQLDDERRRTWEAVAHLDEGGRIVQLADENVPDIIRVAGGNADFAIGRSNMPYRKEISWGESGSDYYRVDLATGEKEMIAEFLRNNASVSPEGRYLSYFDGAELAWFVMDLSTGEVRNVSEAIPHAVHNELHDTPQEPNAYGSAGWTKGDEQFLIYDRHDIWAVDPTGREAPRNITEGVGRRDGLRFRYIDLDAGGGGFGFGGFGGGGGGDDEGIDPSEDLLLSAFHLWNKSEGFYRDRVQGNREPVRLVMDDRSFGRPIKADDADVVMLTRSTFREFPDLYITDLDFGSFERISEANPQQSEYRWGTSELVEWRSTLGEPLQGVLYKPDGFDPSKKYPMMVYFYERLSDNLHNYVTPSAGGSSINISFYVSRGYLVFTPDIPYRIGYPGESAMNAVVPGVLELIDQGFVDPARIGVQGHSWGGYQIAYMVTKTDLFTAAEAGAPVANMISAYGGIRWSSGMSRMFQYEKTQSRLGGSLWEVPMRFIENSPIFWADKVRTPLLMMHNDEDGAVPWYQGIEYFVALRRLDKPVWMLNYNGEDHGLRQEHNRKDWAIRMQQFFDHYLLDAPPPVWMVEGIPAIRKGETLGLELVEGVPGKVTTTTEQAGQR